MMDGQMTIFDYIPTEDEEEQLARQACTTCTHYKTIVDAYTDKPLHKVCHKPGTCYGDMISDPDTHCCDKWEEKNAKK